MDYLQQRVSNRTEDNSSPEDSVMAAATGIDLQRYKYDLQQLKDLITAGNAATQKQITDGNAAL
jgi:hypothetical protein